MNAHQISIAFQTDKSASDYVALAQLVNQYQFDAVTCYGDLPFHPPFGPLMLMAPHIQRARIGIAAVSPARIHPLDIAAQTALLADVAQGGIYLGLTRGAWLHEHGIQESSQPIQAVREAAAVIHQIFTSGRAGYQGQVYTIADHVHVDYPLPTVPIPLLIGTWGKQLAALAGEIADEVKVGGSTNPDFVPIMREYLAVGEAKEGRPAASVGIVMGAVSVLDEDRELARRAARRSVALYLTVVARLDTTVTLEPDFVTRITAHVQQGNLDAAAEMISDDLLNRFAFAGNADDVIEQANRLFAAGASRVEFGTPHGLSTAATGIRILGERVIPTLRQIWR